MDARDFPGTAIVSEPGASGSPPFVVDTPPAFDIVRPAILSTPLVFASPHSGRLYPADMMDASVLDAAAIRRSEDVLVDSLIGAAPALGVPLISARYARAYIDVNREPYELDQAMFADVLPAFAAARTARVAAGLGCIARVVSEGQEIYHRKLTFGEATGRIETVHRPYHAALMGLVEEAKVAAGVAILIDWHSMPSAAAAGCEGRGQGRGAGDAADFVLGDRFGAACSFRITRTVERALQARGYHVARNAPYAGGHTTEFYGRPARGVHALQIEINRALYLDEATLLPGAAFEAFKAKLRAIIAELAAADWSAL